MNTLLHAPQKTALNKYIKKAIKQEIDLSFIDDDYKKEEETKHAQNQKYIELLTRIKNELSTS